MKLSLFLLAFSFEVARAITHSVPISEETRDCVETELRQRTLRVTTPRMSCSGVAVDANRVRLAGHCFGAHAAIGGVYDATGARRADGGVISRQGGNQGSVYFDVPDQAEVTLPEALLNVGPIEMADVEHLPEDNRVVIAGFGFSRFKGPLWKHPWPEKGLRYSWGHVERIASHVPDHRGAYAYRFTPDHPRSAASAGDDGGPAFLVEGCSLKFIGVIVGRRIPAFAGPRTTWIRPHTDFDANQYTTEVSQDRSRSSR